MVIAGLSWLASAIHVPYPVLLVLGGLVLGLVPGLPALRLKPQYVFLIFLPPILYQAAFSLSPRELRRNLRPIGSLVIGLLVATIAIVAVVAHELIGGFGWAAAFALGAVVSPTDPVAATSVFARLGVRRRVATLLEAEGLVNDGVSLVAFKVAAAAAVTGAVSVSHAFAQFLVESAGGIGVGLGVGILMSRVRRRIANPPVEITISLFTPYLAYIPADRAGVSGVLAAVTVGVYLGAQSPSGLFQPRTRLEAFAFWNVLIFVLNGILFILVGLQFEEIRAHLGGAETLRLTGWGLLLSVAVAAIRMAWMFVVPPLERVLWPRLRERDPVAPAGERLVVGWSGMRGAVTLAAALSVPLAVDVRPEIVFVAFIVIVTTLVIPGVTLPALIRRTDVGEQGRTQVETEARLAAVRAALERLDELAQDGELSEELIVQARRRYAGREQYLAQRLEDADSGADGDGGGGDDRLPDDIRGLHRELLHAQRDVLERMHGEGRIGRALTRRLERELDLEASRWSELGAG